LLINELPLRRYSIFHHTKRAAAQLSVESS
jgi:hypothetical protein